MTTKRIGPVPVPDAVIFAAVFLLAFFICRQAANWPIATYHAASNQDVWFDADTRRVFLLSVDRTSQNARAELHPLERIVSYPPVLILRKATGLSGENAVHVFHSAISALWIACFFLLLRAYGLPRADALVFDAVAATSACAMFWMPVTEIFIAGSLSMFPAFAMAARPAAARPVHHYLSAVMSLGLTVTNVMATAFTSLLTLRRSTLIRVGILAAVTVIAGAGVEKAFFPVKRVVLANPMVEAAWVFPPESGGPLAIFWTFFVTSMVAPDISFQHNWLQSAWPFLSFQTSPLYSGTWLAKIAMPVWVGLFIAGFAALVRRRAYATLHNVLVLTILYQLLLHLVYGRETFLYSPHYLIPLVSVAAFSAAGRFRPIVISLALLLCALNVANNVHLLGWSKAYAGRHAALKEIEGKMRFPDSGKPKSDAAVSYRFWEKIGR